VHGHALTCAKVELRPPMSRSRGLSPIPGLNALNDYVLAASFVINRPGDADLRDVSVTGAKHHQTMPRELHFA